MMNRFAVLISLCASIAGCGGTTAPACEGVGVLPIQLHVQAATTGQSVDDKTTLTSKVARTGEVLKGPLVDTPLDNSKRSPLVMLVDQFGQFDITIEVPGFQTQQLSLVVQADGCGSPIQQTRTIAVLPTT